MALDGFTIGSEAPSAGAAPAPTALKGFSVGQSAAPAIAPVAAAAPAPKNISGDSALQGFTQAPPDLSGKSLNLAMPKPVDTSNVFSKFMSMNNFKVTPQVGSPAATKDEPFKDPLDNYVAPKNETEASEGLSQVLNAPIYKAGDLLGSTKFIQEAAAGIDSPTDPSVAGNTAEGMLQKLSMGLQGIQGVTGGFYKAPDLDPNKNNLLDKGLGILSQAVGFGAGITAIGETAFSKSNAAVQGLTKLAARLPLVGKYMAPFIQPLLSMTAGSAVESQLDPTLAGNIKDRAKALGVSIATAPLYTALGAIRNPAAGVPLSFALGYGMAKLNGASNDDSMTSGLAFALLDSFGRANESRGFTAEEMTQKLNMEAQKTLSKYSGIKITDKTSAADLKSAYYIAAHRSHPDVGGTNEAFSAVSNAYNLLSKGAPTSEAEASIKQLSGSVKDSIEKNGDMATHQAIKEQLGVDDTRATILLNAAKTPETPADIKAGHENVIGPILAARPDEQVKSDAIAHVTQNKQQLVDKYVAEHGNIVGADEAKEFLPGYAQDRSTSDLVQKGAAQLSDAVYNHLLEKNQNGKKNTVLITAGGTGSGKSSALSDSGIDPKDYAVVFDSNSANTGSAKARIDAALAKGYSVSLVYVHAPIDKAYDRVLDRAELMTKAKGSGRPVSAQGHMDMHHGAPEAFAALQKEYAGNDRVKIDVIDNSSTQGERVKNPVDFIRKIADNKGNETDLHKALNDQRESALHEGRISERTNAAFQRAEGLRPRKNNEGNDKKLERQESKADVLSPEQIEEKANEDWEKNHADEFATLSDELTKLEQEHKYMKAGPERDALEERADELGDKMAAMENAHLDKWYKGQRGFIAPGKIAEDIAAGAKNVKNTMTQIQNARELTGDVRSSIYQHENARKATRVRLTQMIQEAGDLLDAEGWEHLYHYDENKNEHLSPREKEIYETHIAPLKRTLTDVISDYRAAGGVLTPDLFFMNEGEFTPRFAKDKQSALDKLLEKGKAAIKSIQNGGSLSKSLGTVGKSRKFYAATDENGNRVVTYVPTDKSENVLGFKDKKIEDLGPVKGGRTPKVNEFFDDTVMRKLNDLAASLGITHERVPTKLDAALGRTNAGVSLRGESLIKTRLSPTSVFAHELGHQIDQKYAMQDFMGDERYDAERKKQVTDEMRKLADKRFEGSATTKTFKNYVRKGTEKMAVMFEAYIANREMFKEVAPHLYDDFRDFLNSHDELRPFLDIQPTITLGKETHGGEQTGKIGKTFVDKSGTEYTIGQATTKEIEQNTNVEYHKNVLANYTVALDRAMNALNAMKLVERLKNEEEFGTIIKKDSPDEAPPEGWKAVGDNLPQFRGYHMEPRTAEALADLAGRQRGQVYIPVFDEVNNLLVTAIVLNPIMHVPNVIAGRSLAAATGDISSKTFDNLKTAFDEVRNKGPLYLSYLEHGAPFMALKDTAKSFADAIFTQYTQEVEDNLSEHEELAKILGYANPKTMIDGFNHLNEGITWGSNDIFFMHALLDYRDAHGGTMEEGIKEVSKRMADYRIPERILLPGAAGRSLSVAAQSRVFMFGRFHYSGVIKPWIEAMRDSATGTGAERLAGLRGLAYLLIMGLAVWPYIHKMWQGLTGSPTSYESMPGPLRPVQVGEKLAQQGVPGIPAALQSAFSLSPALRAAIEMGFNTDLFTRNPIYGPLPAEGLTVYGTSLVSPLASASRMTPGDFALSMFGVWTPKNVEAKTALNTMKYEELPALQTQVKKDMATGSTAKANAEMTEFNTRAIATWNNYELETGGKDLITTEAQKQSFLKTWGIKAPGAVAMGHANALYGDGSLTSKSSLIANVATYAKAIGVDPGEAFHLIFSGQQIARVANFGLFNPDSTIIVTRAPLSYTEPIKQSQESVQGNTDQNATLELDHVIPLEAGGTNDENNLNLITTAQNMGEQHTFENTLGAAVSAGTISQAKVREYSIRYKVGQGETLPAQYMADFTGKYGGKTITLKEVQDAINNGQAK